jgi:hypothetical protein
MNPSHVGAGERTVENGIIGSKPVIRTGVSVAVEGVRGHEWGADLVEFRGKFRQGQ